MASAYLCANKPKRTAGADIYNGTTIDQLIAQKIGQGNLLPSMQFAVEDPGANSSNCGEGYSCVHEQHLVVDADDPLPMELNPQLVFERMFGDGGTPEERAARRQDDRSILDSLIASLSRFKVGLDPADRLRVDEHADDIRDRTATADRGKGLGRCADQHGRPGRDPGIIRRAHQAAVRPARAGAPSGHHPRRHAALARDLTVRSHPKAAPRLRSMPARITVRM